MGSIIQKLADEIELHGSYENYCAWRGGQEHQKELIAQNSNLPKAQLVLDPSSIPGVSRILFVKPEIKNE